MQYISGVSFFRLYFINFQVFQTFVCPEGILDLQISEFNIFVLLF
jgi:hypothetical protein